MAILAEENYEDPELWYPYYRMREAGAEVQVVGNAGADVYHSKHGYPFSVDVAAHAVSAGEFDAVIIPGGYASDRMRWYPEMLGLVRGIFEEDGVVAFICHAAWVPISAGILRGKRATSVAAIKDDVINAGAEWLDEEAVVDGNLISSRIPRDLPAFCGRS